MIKIALLGFGTVGSGVAEVIDNNRRVISRRLGEQPEIAHILDLRDFPDSPYAGKIVHDIDTILADPEVRIVAEMMGGVHPAADFTKAAIEAGKSVVTSNKAVVAEEGDKLLRLARKHGVRYLFEASVGGGIPCLRTLADSLSCNDIISVRGILNGSTNYMLTEMTKRGIGYGDILPEARALGYLEADPTADVGGFDAARKIIILAAMAWGKLLPLDAVSTVGITGITPGDISAAAAAGKKIKLVAEATRTGGMISCSVSPRLTSPGSMLYSVTHMRRHIVHFGRHDAAVRLRSGQAANGLRRRVRHHRGGAAPVGGPSRLQMDQGRPGRHPRPRVRRRDPAALRVTVWKKKR